MPATAATETGRSLTVKVTGRGNSLRADTSPEGGYPHGKPASWVLVAVVTAASVTGGISIITRAWVLLWACIAIVVLAIPAGKMIGIMEDTVDWGSTPAATSDPQPSGLQADRGPDESAQIR